MAYSKRYADAILSDYLDIFDMQEQVQFATLHISLQDDTTYIAFRGTDQTICGWKEDFTMPFKMVSSQKLALKYLEDTMILTKQYRIGGHSKGGNLAVYASAMCQEVLQQRIIQIYSNDGPGFSEELLKNMPYSTIEKK